MKKYFLLLVWLALIASMCSCGVSYHLRRASFHTKMAIAKGATVTTDTVYKEVTFKTKPIDVKFTPQVLRDSMRFEKDGVTTDVILSPGKTAEGKDTTMVAVNTYVAPREQAETVPIQANTNVKKPPKNEPYWFIGGFVTCALLVGLILLLLRKREAARR